MIMQLKLHIHTHAFIFLTCLHIHTSINSNRLCYPAFVLAQFIFSVHCKVL